jgi:RimJ/RimL family protein N-acetyltransferase
MLAYRSDPAVAQFQYWEPMTFDNIVQIINTQLQVQPGMLGVPLLLMVEHEGKVIGEISISVNVPEHKQGEAGILFNPAYTGRGLATRALAAVLGFGFVQLDLHRITMATSDDNERSWRLMERVGMRREGHFIHDGFVKGKWANVFSYGMLADEWHSRYPELIASVAP